MKHRTILIWVLVVFVALFSVQNSGAIAVHLLFWQFSMSQALVIILAAFFGVLAGYVAGARAERRAVTPPPDRSDRIPPVRSPVLPAAILPAEGSRGRPDGVPPPVQKL